MQAERTQGGEPSQGEAGAARFAEDPDGDVADGAAESAEFRIAELMQQEVGDQEVRLRHEFVVEQVTTTPGPEGHSRDSISKANSHSHSSE